MIYGTYKNWKHESIYFPQVFTTAFAFLEGVDPATLAQGKYAIDGDKLFAIVQDNMTEPADTRRFELHQKYIDIQLVISGKEQQGYAPAGSSANLLEDALAETDNAFYSKPLQVNTIKLEAGDYAIYLPGELHCACCAVERSEKVRKIVFKIQKLA